jgi:hypothetical protein
MIEYGPRSGLFGKSPLRKEETRDRASKKEHLRHTADKLDHALSSLFRVVQSRAMILRFSLPYFQIQ